MLRPRRTHLILALLTLTPSYSQPVPKDDLGFDYTPLKCASPDACSCDDPETTRCSPCPNDGATAPPSIYAKDNVCWCEGVNHSLNVDENECNPDKPGGPQKIGPEKRENPESISGSDATSNSKSEKKTGGVVDDPAPFPIAAVAGAAGAAAVLILILLIFCILYRRRRRTKSLPGPASPPAPFSPSSSGSVSIYEMPSPPQAGPSCSNSSLESYDSSVIAAPLTDMTSPSNFTIHRALTDESSGRHFGAVASAMSPEEFEASARGYDDYATPALGDQSYPTTPQVSLAPGADVA